MKKVHHTSPPFITTNFLIFIQNMMTYIHKGRALQVFINKINFWADEQEYKCCNVSRSYSSVKRINHKSKQLSTHLIRNIIQCFVVVQERTFVAVNHSIPFVESEKYVLNPPVNVIEEVTCECNMRNGRGKGGKDNAIQYRQRCIPLFYFAEANQL